MKKSKTIGAVAAFAMVSLSQAATYTWTGTDNDWSNTVNWVGGTLPAVTGAGFVGGANNNIVINGGGVQPSVNIPDMAQGVLGESPKITLEAGATLDMTWAPGAGWNGIKGTGTMATVGSGATLTYHLGNYVNYASLARDPSGIPLQTYNVNGGDLVFNQGGRLDLAFNDTRTSIFNLDGGNVIFDHRYGSTTGAPFFEVWGWGTDKGEGSPVSTITLDNGSTFGIARLSRTKWGSGDAAMVFDILDTGSTVNISTTGGDYTTLAAVQADFGSVFISSTLGDAGLQAVEAGGVITVSVIDLGIAPSPFEIWLSGYSVGAFTNELDDAENGGIGDGFNNLLEYALGGDPSVDDAASIMPVSAVDGAVFNYIYTRQNPMDTNLTYIVLDGTDLLAGLGSTNTSETVSGVVDGFETVTNQVSTTVEGQQFMKLKVEYSD